MNGPEAQSSESRLTIERLQSVYLVPWEHPSPEKMRGRFDAVLRGPFASACRQILSSALDADDPSVWLIRRLDIDLAFDAEAVTDDLLAHCWAQRIAFSLTRIIARGADGEHVLCFPNRAAYLAQFVGDLAEGHAWDKWYYDSFDSLRSLTLSAAVREALTRAPEQTVEALLVLSGRGRLERVLSVLGEQDARRVYEACLTSSAGVSDGARPRQLVNALLAVWDAASVQATTKGVAHAHNALRLYLRWRQSAPAFASDQRAHDAILHLLGFAEVLSRVGEPEAFVARLAEGDLRGALRQAQQSAVATQLENLPFMLQAASGDGEWIAHVASILTPATRGRATARTPSSWQSMTTACGALFLLLPSFFELGLMELIQAAPYVASGELGQEEALRYCLALKWLGRPRTIEVAHDFGLQMFVGPTQPQSFDKLQAFSNSATDETERFCQRLLIEELVRRGRADARSLSAELVSVPDDTQAVLLLRDMTHDAWLYAASVGREATAIEKALDQGLALIREVTGMSPECLLLETSLDALLDQDALARLDARPVWAQMPRAVEASLFALDAPDREEQPLTVWSTNPDTLPEEVRQALRRHLAHARAASADLDYLSLAGEELSVAAHFDLTWSLVARAVLKQFANRLMGFSWSSAEYLYQNFMAGASIVRVEEEQIEIQLPPVPLRIILRMAGVDGQTYAVSWLNNAQIILSLAD